MNGKCDLYYLNLNRFSYFTYYMYLYVYNMKYGYNIKITFKCCFHLLHMCFYIILYIII